MSAAKATLQMYNFLVVARHPDNFFVDCLHFFNKSASIGGHHEYNYCRCRVWSLWSLQGRMSSSGIHAVCRTHKFSSTCGNLVCNDLN